MTTVKEVQERIQQIEKEVVENWRVYGAKKMRELDHELQSLFRKKKALLRQEGRQK